jgi:hypothetical protein
MVHILRGLLHVIVAAFLVVSIAQAALVPELYDARLSCQTQNENERQILVKQGLLQVLERLSGDSKIASNPHVKQALASAIDFVEQYSYQENTLVVKYSADLLNNLMTQSGQTVWGQRRPQVVLWLTIEDQQQRRFVTAESDPTIPTLVKHLAQERGLPISLPIMDLEELANISVEDLWTPSITGVRQASQRYGAQVILIGRMVHHSDRWESNWQLLSQDEQAPTWQIQGNTIEELVTQGITQTTQYLIGHYAMTKSPVNNLQMNTDQNVERSIFIGIDNIQSGPDFIKVQEYLNNVDQIGGVSVHHIAGNTAVFEIKPKIQNKEQLEKAIVMEQHLVAISGSESLQSSPPIDLAFRWVP